LRKRRDRGGVIDRPERGGYTACKVDRGRRVASLSELHNEIRWAIEAGDLARSRELCEHILAIRPDHLRTVLLAAEVDLEERRFREACLGFERVLQGDPESYLAYAGLGIGYDNLQNPAGAVRWFARALDLDPANAEIRNERDRLFAIAYPGRVSPSGITTFAMARSLFQSGFRVEGMERLRTALERHPERTEIQLALAEAHWAVGTSGMAQEICREIVRTKPRVVKANALLACIAAEAGDAVSAQEYLVDVHAQDPEGYIAGEIIRQSPLADLAAVDVPMPMEVSDSAGAQPVPRQAVDAAAAIDAPPWVRWMRDALWSALRLIRPAVLDEVAASRAAWARILPEIGVDESQGAEARRGGELRTDDTGGDRTEVIIPGHPRRRPPPPGRPSGRPSERP
jgi:tetratricopeptide (TPR) repeat protein